MIMKITWHKFHQMLFACRKHIIMVVAKQINRKYNNHLAIMVAYKRWFRKQLDSEYIIWCPLKTITLTFKAHEFFNIWSTELVYDRTRFLPYRTVLLKFCRTHTVPYFCHTPYHTFPQKVKNSQQRKIGGMTLLYFVYLTKYIVFTQFTSTEN